MGGGAERWGKGCPKTDLRRNVRQDKVMNWGGFSRGQNEAEA